MTTNPTPERLTAILRIVAVPVLFIGEEFVTKPEPTEQEFYGVLGLFAVYAIFTVIVQNTLSERFHFVLLSLDVAFAGLLSYTSGGAFSQIRLVFLFPIVTAAFRCQPRLTAMVTGTAIVVYVIQALTHASATRRGDDQSFVAVQVAYLAWLGAALSLLSLLLARRERVIVELSRQRQQLVAELQTTEEREQKRLAENLHDHAIQNLLAARHELHDDATADPLGSSSRAFDAITDTVRVLRDTISDMHPHVLDEAGLGAAISQAANRASARSGFRVSLNLEQTAPGPNDRALLRAASELITNAERHASASQLTVLLAHRDNVDTLRVEDDGVGFDSPDISIPRGGHIGLLSLRERAEALGGSLMITQAQDHGTIAIVSLPRSRSDLP